MLAGDFEPQNRPLWNQRVVQGLCQVERERLRRRLAWGGVVGHSPKALPLPPGEGFSGPGWVNEEAHHGLLSWVHPTPSWLLGFSAAGSRRAGLGVVAAGGPCSSLSSLCSLCRKKIS